MADTRLPSSYKRKLLKRAQMDFANGVTLNREERDLLHMETSHKNLAYWKQEVDGADDADISRILHCQAHVRNIAANLHAQETSSDTDHPMSALLESIFTDAGRLPAVHRT